MVFSEQNDAKVGFLPEMDSTCGGMCKNPLFLDSY